MTVLYWILGIYIESVFLCRWLNYHAYIRGIDKNVSPHVWFTPVLNIFGIIVETVLILKSDNFKNWWPIMKFLGRDWDKKKQRYNLDNIKDDGEENF